MANRLGSQHRVFGLDLVRSIAIVLVLVGHGDDLLPRFESVRLLTNGGFLGVEVFFVLSGYLVGTSLIRSFLTSGFSWDVARTFVLRRWFRTLPNYFLFLLLNILLFQFLSDHEKSWNAAYFVFLQNLAWPHPSLMPEAWSLAIEEWFYLLLPLSLMAFGRGHSVGSPRTQVLLGVVAIILAFSSFRFFGALLGDLSWDQGVRKVAIFRMDSLAYGVLLGHAALFHRDFLERWARLLAIAGFVCIAGSIAWNSAGLYSSRDSFAFQMFIFPLASAGTALLIPFFERIRCSSFWIAEPVRLLSVISYSIYLVHISLARPIAMHHLTGAPVWLRCAAYIGLSISLSYFVCRYFELPITNLRDRVLRPRASQRETFEDPLGAAP